MESELRIITSFTTGVLIAALSWLNDGLGTNWVGYLLAFAAGTALTLALFGLLELSAGLFFRRKAAHVEASLRLLLSESGMDVEAFENLSYHTAYVVRMHPGLSTEQLITRPSMKPHLGERFEAEAKVLLQFAGAYFRTSDRFGFATNGTWWLVESNRSARRSMRQHARALSSGAVAAVARSVSA